MLFAALLKQMVEKSVWLFNNCHGLTSIIQTNTMVYNNIEPTASICTKKWWASKQNACIDHLSSEYMIVRFGLQVVYLVETDKCATTLYARHNGNHEKTTHIMSCYHFWISPSNNSMKHHRCILVPLTFNIRQFKSYKLESKARVPKIFFGLFFMLKRKNQPYVG